MASLFRLLIPIPLIVCFCAIGKPQQIPQDQPAKTEKDGAAVLVKLVKQLGSSALAERTAAAKSLEAIGLPALGALREAAKSKDAEVAGQANRVIEAIDGSLEQLLKDYRAYGLPLPPDDAKLVRYEFGGGGSINGKPMPPSYHLGFLLRPGTKDRPALLLSGTREFQVDSKLVQVVEPKIELVKSIDLAYLHDPTLHFQCLARGWKELAQELCATSFKVNTGYYFRDSDHSAIFLNRAALPFLAWDYSKEELVKPNTDRAKTAKRMKAALAAEPKLRTKFNETLLKSLELALVPSKAKPGSVERLIDDLTDLYFSNDATHRDQLDKRYLLVVEKGFQAVPALIEHLEDDRLTRCVRTGFNNQPFQHEFSCCKSCRSLDVE